MLKKITIVLIICLFSISSFGCSTDSLGDKYVNNFVISLERSEVKLPPNDEKAIGVRYFAILDLKDNTAKDKIVGELKITGESSKLLGCSVLTSDIFTNQYTNELSFSYATTSLTNEDFDKLVANLKKDVSLTFTEKKKVK